jgi:hypothetical protein
MPSAADGVTRGTECPQDESNDQDNHSNGPQNRDCQHKSDDEKNQSKNNHLCSNYLKRISTLFLKRITTPYLNVATTNESVSRQSLETHLKTLGLSRVSMIDAFDSDY